MELLIIFMLVIVAGTMSVMVAGAIAAVILKLRKNG